MKKFGIFKMKVSSKSESLEITFTALQNPVDHDSPLVIEAHDISSASLKAKEMLVTFGQETHSVLGCYETIMTDFPNFFVGEFLVDQANKYDNSSIANRVSEFVPVPK